MTDPAELLRQADARHAAVLAWLRREPGPTVVLCDHAPRLHPARTVRLDECLAHVEAYRLVDLAQAAGSVHLDLGDCRAARARPELAALAHLVGDGRLGLEVPEGLPAGALADVARPPVSRRSALGLRRAEAALHPASSDAHQRLLESLAVAGVDDASVSSPALALEATGCIACGVCVQACPHDALSLTHAGGLSTLTHDPSQCHGERACITHCPAQALSSPAPLPWQAALEEGTTTLTTVNTTTCRRCRSRFPDDGDHTCPHCRARSADPFGVHLPPEVLDRLGRGPDGRRL